MDKRKSFGNNEGTPSDLHRPTAVTEWITKMSASAEEDKPSNETKAFTFGVTTSPGSSPSGPSFRRNDGSKVEVQQVCCGGKHNLAVAKVRDRAGVRIELFAWGRAEFGRLGLGEDVTCCLLFPEVVDGLNGEMIQTVAAGGYHSIAVVRFVVRTPSPNGSFISIHD